MNNFALEIWDNDCPKCIFYTVRWNDAVANETDKFFIDLALQNGEITAGKNRTLLYYNGDKEIFL